MQPFKERGARHGEDWSQMAEILRYRPSQTAECRHAGAIANKQVP
jgi:hypothetical protein